MRGAFRSIGLLFFLLAVFIDASPVRGETLSFESADYAGYAELYAHAPKRTVTLTGDLTLPPNATGRVPAVILVHGSGGRKADQESYWVTEINRMGIAAFAVDLFRPRGYSTWSVRGLPFASMVTDVYGALRKLADDPRIDGKRVAVVGFSMGAEVARQAAFEPFRKGALGNADLRLAAHVAFYPLCVTSADGADAFTGAPVLILSGELDDATPVVKCRETLAYFATTAPRAPLRLIVYPGAHHAWDDPTKHGYYERSPSAKDCIPRLLGADGKVAAAIRNGKRIGFDSDMRNCAGTGSSMQFDPDIRARSMTDLAAFFKETLLKP